MVSCLQIAVQELDIVDDLMNQYSEGMPTWNLCVILIKCGLLLMIMSTVRITDILAQKILAFIMKCQFGNEDYWASVYKISLSFFDQLANEDKLNRHIMEKKCIGTHFACCSRQISHKSRSVASVTT
jgi:hypothetical protein